MSSSSPGQPRGTPRRAGHPHEGTPPPPPGGPPPTRPPARAPLPRRWQYLLIPALLLGNFLLIQLVTPGQPQRVEVSYTFFKQQVEADNVAQISTRADSIQGTFKQAV